MYALGQIPTYWLINLVNRQIEVMSNPQLIDDLWRYTNCQIFQPGDSIEWLVEGQPIGTIAVADILD